MNGSRYTDPEDITLNMTEDAVYMGMKNSVSFLIADRSEVKGMFITEYDEERAFAEQRENAPKLNSNCKWNRCN